MAIHLKPIPNRSGVLASNFKGSAPDAECEQEITFPVRVVNTRRHGEIRLATGEKMETLEGDVTLCRGKKRMEGDEYYPNALFYVEPFLGDEEFDASDAAFRVQLFLDHRVFDQIITLSCAKRLPWINLGFDFRGPITYGDNPDGSDKFWNNKEHPFVNIESMSFTIPLVDHIEEPEEELESPELITPSSDQFDQQFREIHKVLVQLYKSLSLLTWIVGIGVVLEGVRIFV